MKALPRIFVTGTIGCLAVLAAASSGAFACTASSSLKVSDPPPRGYMAPGDVLTLEITKFDTAETATPVSVLLIASGGERVTLAVVQPPAFTFTWTIPATGLPPSAGGKYTVLASQQNLGYKWERPWSVEIATGAGPAPTIPPATAPPTSASPVPSTVVPPRESDGAGQREAAPIGGAIGSVRAVVPGFSAAAPPAAPGAVTVLAPGTAAAGATERASADGGLPPPQDRTAPALAALPQLPAQSLWSGLDGGAPPSLLDPSVPVDRGGGPLGGLLLGAGAGVLALTGSAVGLRRRRLAPARR